MKASDAIIKEWAERHDLQGTLTDLRACFDDARSLFSTPPADTSTAGEWTEEYVRAVLSNYGESHLAINHNASHAPLREQLASAEQQLLNREQRWEESERIRERAEQQLAEANRQLEIKRGTIKKLGEQLAKHPGWEPDTALAASAQKADTTSTA